MICHNCYFLDNGSKFQSSVGNGCYDVLRISVDLFTLTLLLF